MPPTQGDNGGTKACSSEWRAPRPSSPTFISYKSYSMLSGPYWSLYAHIIISSYLSCLCHQRTSRRGVSGTEAPLAGKGLWPVVNDEIEVGTHQSNTQKQRGPMACRER